MRCCLDPSFVGMTSRVMGYKISRRERKISFFGYLNTPKALAAKPVIPIPLVAVQGAQGSAGIGNPRGKL